MAQLQQIAFEIDNPCLASLIEAGRAGSVDLGGGGRTHELYSGWQFHVETFRFDQRRTVLIEKLPGVEMEVAFQRSVNLNIHTPSGTQTVDHVRSIHIDGMGYVSASTRSDTNPQPEPQSTQQPTPQSPNTQVINRLNKALEECRTKLTAAISERDRIKEENDRLNKALEKCRANLNDATSERDRIKEENDRMKDQNRTLQNSLNGQLTDLERSITQKGLNLNDSLQETLNRVNDKRAENEKLRRRLSEVKSEEDSILGLRDDLHEEMDVARERLDEIRNHLGTDSDILTLMQEEPFLKGMSVRKLLDEAEKTLDRAEQRIGNVVQLRERINSTLLNTILSPSEDGTVPADNEFGGNHNGIRGSATTTD